jgi:hypothetical protein
MYTSTTAVTNDKLPRLSLNKFRLNVRNNRKSPANVPSVNYEGFLRDFTDYLVRGFSRALGGQLLAVAFMCKKSARAKYAANKYNEANLGLAV